MAPVDASNTRDDCVRRRTASILAAIGGACCNAALLCFMILALSEEADETVQLLALCIGNVIALNSTTNGGTEAILALLEDLCATNGRFRRLFISLRGPNLHRGQGGWRGSHMMSVLNRWPDRAFKRKMRMAKTTFRHLVTKLEHKLCPDAECRNPNLRVPAYFKVGVCVHHLAHGGSFYAVAGHASIAEDTARNYILDTCNAIFVVLVPIYLRPPTTDEAKESQRIFATRRNIGNVGLAVDGTHIPWQPDCEEWMDEYRNYKGWYSILVVAVVNGFGMFVDAEVGHTGRSSDSTVAKDSQFMADILANRIEWLGGPDGIMISDGAFQCGNVVLTPFPMPANGQHLEEYQRWFNFCFSSTRIIVEQVFGVWKSSWRVLLKESDCGRHTLSMIVMATMVLHNMICIERGGVSTFFDVANDIEDMVEMADAILQFMRDYEVDRCPDCRRHLVIHCIHINRSKITSKEPDAVKLREELARKLWERRYEDNYM